MRDGVVCHDPNYQLQPRFAVRGNSANEEEETVTVKFDHSVTILVFGYRFRAPATVVIVLVDHQHRVIPVLEIYNAKHQKNKPKTKLQEMEN